MRGSGENQKRCAIVCSSRARGTKTRTLLLNRGGLDGKKTSGRRRGSSLDSVYRTNQTLSGSVMVYYTFHEWISEQS